MSCLVAMNLIHTKIPARPSRPAVLASSIKSDAMLNLKGKNRMSDQLRTNGTKYHPNKYFAFAQSNASRFVLKKRN